MITYNQNTNDLKIIIPINSIVELHNYKKGLLGILAEIEIKECHETLKDNLKSVYQLLSHLVPDAELLSQHEFLLNGEALTIISAHEKVKRLGSNKL